MSVISRIQLVDSGILNTIGNGLMFNVSWFAIVVSQSALLAISIAIIHLVVHFRLMGRGTVEVSLIAGVSVLGIAIDQALFGAGVFTQGGIASLPPVWMSCIWPVLATTLLHAFSGLAHRPLLAMMFGAIGGAGSYMAGTRMSDVDFGSPIMGPVIMGVLWALLFPALLKLANRLTNHGGNIDAN
ncbi:MAG: DUF2878 domain-containing protein [Halioglobus sp.]